jgi:hypothetical protein
MTVQFPGHAFNTTDAGNDILSPLETLEQNLYILPTDDDVKKAGVTATFQGPPQSVSIIEAGATALSKWWSVVIAGLGGAAVITSAVTKFWSGQTGGVRIVLIGGLAGVLIAALIAISIMVAADVRGRAQGQVALYMARANIAGQFLQQSAGHPIAPAPQGNPPPVEDAAVAVQGNPPPPADALGQVLNQGVPIYLATSSAPALVMHKPSNQAGYLAGVRQLDDGTTELLLVRQSDQQTTWCAAGDITVTEFTYPREPV